MKLFGTAPLMIVSQRKISLRNCAHELFLRPRVRVRCASSEILNRLIKPPPALCECAAATKYVCVLLFSRDRKLRGETTFGGGPKCCDKCLRFVSIDHILWWREDLQLNYYNMLQSVHNFTAYITVQSRNKQKRPSKNWREQGCVKFTPCGFTFLCANFS
jgi:hypothetical protein